MKLVFKKNGEMNISVLFKDGVNESQFDYIIMIKDLISTKKLEDPEFEGDFSDAEKDSVRDMIKNINREVKVFCENSKESQ